MWKRILFFYIFPLLKKRIAHTKVRCVEKVAMKNTFFFVLHKKTCIFLFPLFLTHFARRTKDWQTEAHEKVGHWCFWALEG
jgi:hypothetical protein